MVRADHALSHRASMMKIGSPELPRRRRNHGCPFPPTALSWGWLLAGALVLVPAWKCRRAPLAARAQGR